MTSACAPNGGSARPARTSTWAEGRGRMSFSDSRSSAAISRSGSPKSDGLGCEERILCYRYGAPVQQDGLFHGRTLTPGSSQGAGNLAAPLPAFAADQVPMTPFFFLSPVLLPSLSARASASRFVEQIKERVIKFQILEG
ncbi:hypothetical protein CDAR_233691 [Caerostris darwini]|uniref:Uncharacterized protein n=1 Tax=Caerostris darwini TaxID=1538125 RepID=A0AAV4PYE9_9ARAC|nr:hypothetical protein CDAR_233691 [Caerostris darwini]